MKEEIADRHFNCTDEERAVFEAGIKLGGMFHQYTGIPLNLTNVDEVERMIEKSLGVQPYVKKAVVSIDRNGLPKGGKEFDYTTLEGRMLSIELVVVYKGSKVLCGMEYVKELDYPLMFVREVGSTVSDD